MDTFVFTREQQSSVQFIIASQRNVFLNCVKISIVSYSITRFSVDLLSLFPLQNDVFTEFLFCFVFLQKKKK